MSRAATIPAWRLGWQRPQLALAGTGVAGGAVVGAAAAFGPAAALAALVACLGAAAVAARPATGLLVLAAIVPAVSGLQRGLPVPGLRLSELLAAGVAAVVLLRLDARSAPRWRAFDWAALAYAAGHAAIGAASVLARGDDLSAVALGTLFGPFQFLLLYRAALAVLEHEDRRAAVLRAVLLSGLAVSALALAQRFGPPAVNALMTALTGIDAQQAAAEEARAFGRAEPTPRTTGPFPHWQVLAGYLLVVALLAVGLLLEPAQRVLRARWLLAVLAAATAAMVASGTFTTTVGLVAAALVLGAAARRLPHVAGTLALGAVGLGALFWGAIAGRVDQQFLAGGSLVPQSVAYRIDLWTEQLLPLLGGRWLAGYGPELPPGLFFPYTESVYLTLLLRGGVILLALYALAMVALGAAAARDWGAADPLRRASARVLLVLVLLLVPFHFIEPYFLTTGLPHLLWLLAAVVLAAGRTREAAP